MGIFSHNDEKLSSKEVHRALYGISGIDRAERDEITDALGPDLDMGGISKFELKRTLRNLEKDDKISRDHRRRLENHLL